MEQRHDSIHCFSLYGKESWLKIYRTKFYPWTTYYIVEDLKIKTELVRKGFSTSFPRFSQIVFSRVGYSTDLLFGACIDFLFNPCNSQTAGQESDLKPTHSLIFSPQQQCALLSLLEVVTLKIFKNGTFIRMKLEYSLKIFKKLLLPIKSPGLSWVRIETFSTQGGHCNWQCLNNPPCSWQGEKNHPCLCQNAAKIPCKFQKR